MSLTLNSCDNSEGENEGKFDANNESGWVQFQTNAIQISLGTYDFDNLLKIPVEVNVPVVLNDLEISYTMESVSGANPNTVFSNSGLLVNPAGTSSHFDLNFPEIEFNITEALNANITETMVFDVVLDATDNSNVSIGINGTEVTRPTTYRVTICPILDTAMAPLLASSDFFIGDYNLTVTSGGSLFGGDVFADQVITLSEGANGSLSREFTVAYEPGGSTNDMTVSFSFETNGQITVDDGLSTNIGCNSLLLLGGDSTNIFTFDSCTVSSTDTLTLNMLDFQGGSGGCGVGDITLTVVLTKV